MKFGYSSFLAFYCILMARCAVVPTPAVPQLNNYDFEEIHELIEEDPRPVAIFIQADWCQFCKNMEQTTFKDPHVVDILNNDYYFISFDGEQEESIQFRNQTFHFKPTGKNTGTHELAVALNGSNDLIYPTFLLLNPKYEVVFSQNAFIDARVLTEILKKGIVSK